MDIRITINGQVYDRSVSGNITLLRFLREEMGFTGTKEGCGAGECGACTVILDGHSVNACMVLAAECDGADVKTIEGEAREGKLSDIQAAFDRHHAVQCGFCTAGMVMSVRDLMARNPEPSVAEIKEGLEGNFCRCTGYTQIIEAVLDVTGQGQEGGLKHV